MERKGSDFFNTARADVLKFLYADDQETFLKTFTRENVIDSLDKYGNFTATYRLMVDGEPQYVNMRAVRMSNDDDHMIIGVYDVDAQMKQQEALERLREESTTFSRISILMGDFIAIYTVDPETGNYMQYSAAREYSDLGTSKAGLDFFADSLKESEDKILPEDYDEFKKVFTKENVLEKTKDGSVFKIHYRLKIGGEPVRISLRAGLLQEKDGPQLIVGVSRSVDELK